MTYLQKLILTTRIAITFRATNYYPPKTDYYEISTYPVLGCHCFFRMWKTYYNLGKTVEFLTIATLYTPLANASEPDLAAQWPNDS